MRFHSLMLILSVTSFGCGSNNPPPMKSTLKPLINSPSPASDQEDAESPLVEATLPPEEKVSEATFENAIDVQHPKDPGDVPSGDPRQKKHDEELKGFLSFVRSLAADEFAFRDATTQVYHSVFNFDNITPLEDIDYYYATHDISFGRYDFTTQLLPIYLNFRHKEEKNSSMDLTSKVVNFRGYKSRISLLAFLPADEATARQLKTAANNRSLEIEVWYKFSSIESAEEKTIPFSDDPDFMPTTDVFDYVFGVDVLKHSIRIME